MTQIGDVTKNAVVTFGETQGTSRMKLFCILIPFFFFLFVYFSFFLLLRIKMELSDNSNHSVIDDGYSTYDELITRTEKHYCLSYSCKK